MKLKISILGLLIVCIITFISCTNESEDLIELEQQEQELSSPVLKLPALRMNHPTKGTSAGLSNDRYLKRRGSNFDFYLPKGTLNRNRPRKQARIEVFTHNQKKGKQTFEANYSVNTTLPGQVTVAQLFASGEGPNVRIEVRSNGQLKAGFGDGKPAAVLARKYNRKNFRIKISTDGKTASIWLNGKKKVSSRKLRYRNAANEFRWGLYYNDRAPKSIRASVKNVRITN